MFNFLKKGLPLLVVVSANCVVTALFIDNFNMILIVFSPPLSYLFFSFLFSFDDFGVM